VRGVEAGRAGTGPEAGPVRLDVWFVKGGWLGGKKEKGWETVGDCVGNGFEFGNGFEIFTFGAELFVGTENGFAFAAAGNGFIVCPCPVLGNGFVGCVFGLVGRGLIPRKPFCAEKGFGTVGTGGGGFVWPNGESPEACMGKVLARKGFTPVICN